MLSWSTHHVFLEGVTLVTSSECEASSITDQEARAVSEGGRCGGRGEGGEGGEGEGVGVGGEEGEGGGREGGEEVGIQAY